MLGEVLKSIRFYHKLNQSAVAAKLGTTTSQISEVESGKKTASFKLVKKYSDEFGIPVSNIYYIQEKLEKKETSSPLTEYILTWMNQTGSHGKNNEDSSN